LQTEMLYKMAAILSRFVCYAFLSGDRHIAFVIDGKKNAHR